MEGCHHYHVEGTVVAITMVEKTENCFKKTSSTRGERTLSILVGQYFDAETGMYCGQEFELKGKS